MMLYSFSESPLGELLLTSREGKLTGLFFTDQPHAPEIGAEWRREEDAPVFVQTRHQLQEYASGTRRKFDLPLGEDQGTPFQRAVWTEMARIPFGQTMTYGELAGRVGAPQAVRAVGAAAGRNPLCWIVPCHRVIGKNERLTGYAGGLSRKRALLDFEGTRSQGRRAVLAPEEPLVAAA